MAAKQSGYYGKGSGSGGSGSSGKGTSRSSSSKGGSSYYDDGNYSSKGGSSRSYDDDRGYSSKGSSGRGYDDDRGYPSKGGGSSYSTPSKGGGSETHRDSGYQKGSSSYNYDDEPITDPPYVEERDSFSKSTDTDSTKTGSDSRISKGGGDTHSEPDMVFTEEEVYGSSHEDGGSARDEAYIDDEPDQDEHETIQPLRALTASQIQQVKRQMHIPEDGFLVETARGRIRKNLETTRINQLIERLNEPEIRAHITDTINLFVNDTDERSHQGRNEIDIAFILAVAIRESGVSTALAHSNNRIVTAGRDAHSRGRSGLDWVYDYRNYFPRGIRAEVHPVVGNDRVPGELIRDVHPAYLRERDLLAAFIVEIRQRKRRFLRRFHSHEFARALNETQRNQLLSSMNRHSERAWIQAAFGSKLTDLLVAVREGIQSALDSGTSFSSIVSNDELNLNAIIANDRIMPTNLSRQRTRISAAEALLVEQSIGNTFS